MTPATRKRRGRGDQIDETVRERIAEMARRFEPSDHIANILGISRQLVRKVRALYGIRPPPKRYDADQRAPGLRGRHNCVCGQPVVIALVKGRAIVVDAQPYEVVTKHVGTAAGALIVARRKHSETCRGAPPVQP